jgi:hypothetical protein
VDEYIPLSVLFESEELSSPIYWRAGDGKYSLVEIGLNRKTGAIYSITLTSIPSENVCSGRVLIAEEEWVKGLPSFDTTEWVEGQYDSDFMDDFSIDISLSIGEDSLSLNFKNSGAVKSFIRNYNVCFGMSNDGKLLSIILLGLAPQKISILKKYM